MQLHLGMHSEMEIMGGEVWVVKAAAASGHCYSRPEQVAACGIVAVAVALAVAVLSPASRPHR